MCVVRDGISQTAFKSKESEQVAAKHQTLQVARDTRVQVVLGEEKASSASAGAKTD